MFRFQSDFDKIKEENERLIDSNKKYKNHIFLLKKKIKWYENFIRLENQRFENKFSNKLSNIFSSTQIKLLLYPKKKVYRWTPQDISSAISLRSVSPKAYRFLRLKKDFPLPG